MKTTWIWFSLMVIATIAQKDFLTSKQREILDHIINIITEHFSSADPIFLVFPRVEFRTEKNPRTLKLNLPSENINLIDSIITMVHEELGFSAVTYSSLNNMNNLDPTHVKAFQCIILAWPTSQIQNTFVTLNKLFQEVALGNRLATKVIDT